MRRALEPCGTTAAYQRHKRRDEEPCAACKDAWNHRGPKKPRESRYLNREQSAMDRLLEKRPPQIEWVKTRGGVWVAVKVIDPHAETPQSPLRAQRQAEHYAQKKAPECMNESLLAAARSEL